MKAIQLHKYGGPEQLRYLETPLPTEGTGEVLVEVRAAGVNPFDLKVCRGDLTGFIHYELPLIPGWDVSGVVVKAGIGATRFSPGDAVFGQADYRRNGAYAEYIIVTEDRLQPKPNVLDHVAAAATPIAMMAAWQALFAVDAINLQSGQTILIHGAAGGVGSFAVQLAAWRGADVIATGSARCRQLVEALGASRFIDYRTERFEELIDEVDAVLDTVGGDVQARSWPLLKRGGTLAALAGGTVVRQPNDGDRRIVAPHGADALPDMDKITALLNARIVRPIVGEILPLNRARDAHKMLLEGGSRGKVVLQVS